MPINKTDFSKQRSYGATPMAGFAEQLTNFGQGLISQANKEEQAAREKQLFDLKMDEANRAKQEREALAGYKFNPMDAITQQRQNADEMLVNRYDTMNKAAEDALKKAGYNLVTQKDSLGNTTSTKWLNAAGQEATGNAYDQILKKAGVENPALSADRAKALSGIYENIKPFKEDVEAQITTDLVAKGVDPVKAKQYAQLSSSGYESVADRQKLLNERAKIANEAEKDAYKYAKDYLKDLTTFQGDSKADKDKVNAATNLFKQASNLGNSSASMEAVRKAAKVDKYSLKSIEEAMAAAGGARTNTDGDYTDYGKPNMDIAAFKAHLKAYGKPETSTGTGKKLTTEEFNKLYPSMPKTTLPEDARTAESKAMSNRMSKFFESAQPKTSKVESKEGNSPKSVTAMDMLKQQAAEDGGITYEKFNGELGKGPNKKTEETKKSAFNPDGTISIENLDQAKEVLGSAVEKILPATKSDRVEQAARQQAIKKAFEEGTLSADQKEWIERSTKTPNGRKILKELGIYEEPITNPNAMKYTSGVGTLDNIVRKAMYGNPIQDSIVPNNNNVVIQSILDRLNTK